MKMTKEEQKRAELFERMLQLKKQDGTFESYSRRVGKRRDKHESNSNRIR